MTLTSGPVESRQAAAISVLGQHAGRGRAYNSNLSPTSAAWPQANRAYLVPFYLSGPFLAQEIFFVSGTTPGTANFDLGVYRDDFTRIVSLGATAAVNTTDIPQPSGGGDIQDTLLQAGRYYLAMSAAATTITVRAAAPTNSFLRALGMAQMDTAHPLPATITPASVGASTFMPNLFLAGITNVL